MKTIVRITVILATIKHISSLVEYKINDDYVPSYLKYTSMDLSDTLMNKDLKFELSLSRIIGTLLYAIDSQQNQLILSLYNNINERLKIEFRGGDEKYVSLKDLCGCNRCKYQWLSINIKIEKQITIKCNQKVNEFPYDEKIKLSTGYPVLNQSEQIGIYFINTPKHENGYPNNEQLQGCIKDVHLNGKPLDLIPSPKELPKCESPCANVCTAGKYHETLSKMEICDCGDTFSNGKYCISNYPVLNQSEKIGIYFINTPKHEKDYPNNEQLQGCIKDVLLNGKPLDLIPFPKGLRKCERTCDNNVCNTGNCHETHYKMVICDCDDTFSNGKYCISSMSNGPITNITSLKNRKLKSFKLTWQSKDVNILNINYQNFNFSIKVESGSLKVAYEERNEVIKGTLSKKYNASTNSTLLISFKTTSVICKFNEQSSGEFPVPRDISQENIKSLKLLDRRGKIDIFYQNDLLENISITVEYPEEKAASEVNWKCIILILEVVLLFISIVMWGVICKKKSKCRNQSRPNSSESVALNTPENCVGISTQI